MHDAENGATDIYSPTTQHIIYTTPHTHVGITISRDTIHIEGMRLGFKRPVLFERHGHDTSNTGTFANNHTPARCYAHPQCFRNHLVMPLLLAVGGEYGAGWASVGVGRVQTVFTPYDGVEQVIVDQRSDHPNKT